ncbi:class A beta-lactamase [Ideonella sp.]|uniref:class A beta-lactamase n=1 Tax=Ideonella sp. TaxID=1929293 RepID=UPI0035B00F9D
MDRRSFAALITLAASGLARAADAAAPHDDDAMVRRWQALEAQAGGRLGVTLIDPARQQRVAWRGGERFPMCSTFKWPLAAAMLARVDAGAASLDQVLRYGRDELVAHSPFTERHAGRGMRVGDLCAATVAHSDNTAANVLLRALGGPSAFTRFVRAQGDAWTRLDRDEPALNEARPGDERDTTTPDAMAALMQRLLLGDGLSPAARQQLKAWGLATVTSGIRLRKGLPAGWQLADKTGTNDQGSANDVGVFWTSTGRPIVVAAYLTQSTAPMAGQNAVHAAIAAQVFQRG